MHSAQGAKLMAQSSSFCSRRQRTDSLKTELCDTFELP
jgi:hypothetical protein